MAEGVADRYDSHRVTPAERESLYLDGVEWFRRYGVSDRAVPPTRAAFQAEWDRVPAPKSLEMNSAVEFVLDLLHHPEPLRPGRIRSRPLLRSWPCRPCTR